MKQLVIMALLCVLTACTGYESTTGLALVNPVLKPASLSFFKVGDNVIITFPDGSTLNGVVVKVGEVRVFYTGHGLTTEISRAYTIRAEKTIQIPGLDGDFIVEFEVPEFALTLQKK